MKNADEMYARASETRKRLLELREKEKVTENILKEELWDYRKESVQKVLDFIKSEYRNRRLCDLDILLTHCQNKLNGNIDGVELDLSDGHLSGLDYTISEIK